MHCVHVAACMEKVKKRGGKRARPPVCRNDLRDACICVLNHPITSTYAYKVMFLHKYAQMYNIVVCVHICSLPAYVTYSNVFVCFLQHNHACLYTQTHKHTKSTYMYTWKMYMLHMKASICHARINKSNVCCMTAKKKKSRHAT
jgi:hypothetical protein